MSVYNPTGSGNVHTDRVMSGRKPVAKGMGFKAAAASVAKKGVPAKQAKAIIAAGARSASPAAKKANPALKKVAGKAMGEKVTKPAKPKGGQLTEVTKPAPKKGYAGGANMCTDVEKPAKKGFKGPAPQFTEVHKPAKKGFTGPSSQFAEVTNPAKAGRLGVSLTDTPRQARAAKTAAQRTARMRSSAPSREY